MGVARLRKDGDICRAAGVKEHVNEPSRNKDNGDWPKKKKEGEWGRITVFERTPCEIRAQSHVSDQRRRQSARR